MPTISNDPDHVQAYNARVSEEGAKLDGALAEIRAAQDCGELSIKDAAATRIGVLEANLNALKLLRDEFLGG